MSLPVRTVSRFLAPLIFVYALYLVILGTASPGGAFGGGVVVGVVACLAVVAEETGGRLAFNVKWAALGRTLGFAAIIITASLSLPLVGTFLDTAMITRAGTILGSPLLVVLAFAAGMVVGGEMMMALVEMLGSGEKP